MFIDFFKNIFIIFWLIIWSLHFLHSLIFFSFRIFINYSLNYILIFPLIFPNFHTPCYPTLLHLLMTPSPTEARLSSQFSNFVFSEILRPTTIYFHQYSSYRSSSCAEFIRIDHISNRNWHVHSTPLQFRSSKIKQKHFFARQST